MNSLNEQAVQDEVSARLLTPEVVRAARQRAASEQRSVPSVLEEQLSVPADALARVLGQLLHHRVFDNAALASLAPAFDLIDYAECARRACLALRDEGVIFVVTGDPFDDALQAWAVEHLRAPHELGLASADDIAAVLARHEDSRRAIDTAMPTAGQTDSGATDLEDLSIRSIGEGTSVVVKLVHSTLYDALKSGVSDIHVESHLSGLVIKYRLDGTLTQVGSIEGREIAEQVLSRLKVMSELDIAERRVPQDGRFRVRALGREIDFRVSIMPSIHGEDAVVRALIGRSGLGSAA